MSRRPALQDRVSPRSATKSSAVKIIRAREGGYDLEKGRRRDEPAARIAGRLSPADRFQVRELINRCGAIRKS
jgi:hypothetical protein